jgi:DNA-binding LacI/PurR family transcriptional regulator
MIDVAARAGVSHQTVSRVINGFGKVAPDTRERVLQAIDELGYHRNSMARALVTGRTEILGLVTTTSVAYGPSSMLLAVELAARRAGYFTGVAPVSGTSGNTVTAAVDHFLRLGAEGLVVFAPTEDIARDLSALDVPVPVVAVTARRTTPRAGGVTPVSVDQHGGARAAVEHLIDLGHRDIAHVPGPADWFEAQAREAAWRESLSEASLPARESSVRGWDAQTGYDAGAEMAREGAPTAVFAANDDIALGLVHAFHDVGLRVPEDVSVVGFDDAPGTAFYLPRLTTVRQDFSALGDQVVQTMVRAIRGDSRVEPVTVPAELVVRASTAPPRLRDVGARGPHRPRRP